VTDLTHDVLELKDDLSKAALEMDKSSVPFQIDIHTMTKMDAERLIMDFLVGKNYIMALHHVQNLRYVISLVNFCDILNYCILNNIKSKPTMYTKCNFTRIGKTVH